MYTSHNKILSTFSSSVFSVFFTVVKNGCILYISLRPAPSSLFRLFIFYIVYNFSLSTIPLFTSSFTLFLTPPTFKSYLKSFLPEWLYGKLIIGLLSLLRSVYLYFIFERSVSFVVHVFMTPPLYGPFRDIYGSTPIILLIYLNRVHFVVLT